MNWAKDPDTIAQCGVIAALLEVSGYPKPGNVHRTQNFADLHFEHFLASSVALFPVLQEICNRGKKIDANKLEIENFKLGRFILKGVNAIQNWQLAGNTHLGTILLFIPLVAAAAMLINNPNPSISIFRDTIDTIIRHTTVEDTINLYQAIQLANPGGLGSVEKFDLKSTTPEMLRKENINLFEIFKLSAARDSIAKEMISRFKITFEVGYPFFKEVFNETNDINLATVHTYLKILGDIPDTLIIRKYGIELAQKISERAKYILIQGGMSNQQTQHILWDFDSELRSDKKINPGTTADLTAATLMVTLIEGLRF